MPIDPFDPGTSVAQHFPTQEPDTFRRLAQIIAAQKREMFDSRQSILANVSKIVGDLTTQVEALAAQNVQILDLIANTVKGAQAGTWVVNFTVPTTATAVASRTITVPAGFTNALVFASAHVSAQNTSAGPDILYVGASINGVAPAMIYAAGAAGAYVTTSGSASRSLTGLSGGSITVEARINSNSNPWSAFANNIASIDVIAIFYR